MNEFKDDGIYQQSSDPNTEHNRFGTYKQVSKNLAKNILIGIGVFLLLYGQCVGLYHSNSKHPDDGLNVWYFPPVAWYRSVEMWWHDDFAGVDWNKRLEYDGQACIGLINASADIQQGEAVEYAGKVGKAIEELSKEINKYPKDKKEYLKRLSKEYILYIESFWSDLMDVIKTPTIGMRKSQATLKYEDKLKEYPFVKGQIEIVDKLTYDKLKEIPQENWSTITPEEHRRIIETTGLAFNDIKNKMRSTYKNIFNEELRD